MRVRQLCFPHMRLEVKSMSEDEECEGCEECETDEEWEEDE